MTFAQITGRRGLRDLVIRLRAQRSKLSHMGICEGIAHTALADTNEVRDWRIWQDFAQGLPPIARPLYDDEDVGLDLDNSVYALDSSIIDLSLNAFPRCHFRYTKAAFKIHIPMDAQGSIATVIRVSDGNLHDVKALDGPPPQPGAPTSWAGPTSVSGICFACSRPMPASWSGRVEPAVAPALLAPGRRAAGPAPRSDHRPLRHKDGCQARLPAATASAYAELAQVAVRP